MLAERRWRPAASRLGFSARFFEVLVSDVLEAPPLSFTLFSLMLEFLAPSAWVPPDASDSFPAEGPTLCLAELCSADVERRPVELSGRTRTDGEAVLRRFGGTGLERCGGALRPALLGH